MEEHIGAFHGKIDSVFHPTAVGNKLSIVFTVGDGIGSLQRALGLFAKHGINMTSIESKPSKGLTSTTFDFIVDFDGFPEDPAVRRRVGEGD